MNTKRNHNFSLIEILIAVSLIGIALSAIFVNIPALIKKERLESGFQQIQHQIALASELMMIHETDVDLVLEVKKEGVLCSIKLESEELKKSYKIKPLLIKGIEKMVFEGEEKGALALHFLFDNYLLPQGKITFCNHKNEKTIVLVCPHEKNKKKAFPLI